MYVLNTHAIRPMALIQNRNKGAASPLKADLSTTMHIVIGCGHSLGLRSTGVRLVYCIFWFGSGLVCVLKIVLTMMHGLPYELNNNLFQVVYLWNLCIVACDCFDILYVTTLTRLNNIK